MSGISFKISAPSRPSSASAPPTRPSSGAGHRRPPPTSGRAGDSSDEDGASGASGGYGRGQGSRKRARLDEEGEEEVVEFGAQGAKSKHARPAPTGPLVIPALPNKDWRRAAEDLRAARPGGGARKKQLYLPESGSGGMSMTSRVEGAAATSSSQAVAEAVADQVNAEPVVGGLEQPVRRARDAQNGADGGAGPLEAAPPPPPSPPTAPVQAAAPALTDEQRALRELLGGADGGEQEQQELAAIYSGPDARTGPADEGDAFKQDVSSRPDEASLDDYARVPVGQFGLAMLRGMGWQPGQPASRNGRAGPTEAYVPSARPHMLGIGAKPMAEAMGTGAGAGAGGKGGKKDAPRRQVREDMRFVPLVKQARASGGESASGSGRSTPLPLPPADRSGSGPSSRRASRSPPPSSSSRRDRDRDYDRDRGSSRRDRDRDDERSSSRRDRDRDDGRSSRRDRDRDDYRDRERERERGSSTRDRDYERRDDRRDRDRDRGERRERDRR